MSGVHTLRVYRPLQSRGHASTLARSALGVGIGPCASHLTAIRRRGQCGSNPTTQTSWPCSRRLPKSSQQSRRVGLPALILRGPRSRLMAGVAASPRRVRRLRGLGLRHLLGFRPVFLCSYRSHLVLMIARKTRTKFEKVVPGSALKRGLRAAGSLGVSGPPHVRIASPIGKEAV